MTDELSGGPLSVAISSRPGGNHVCKQAVHPSADEAGVTMNFVPTS